MTDYVDELLQLREELQREDELGESAVTEGLGTFLRPRPYPRRRCGNDVPDGYDVDNRIDARRCGDADRGW